MNFNLKYEQYLSDFEKFLKEYLSLNENKYNKNIYSMISYSVLNGGKRIRPILCLSTLDMLSGEYGNALPFSLAIELIHSYSLVHDDLPSMDNDDYRRGKLSTHKMFGEANGILCGDALLNLAFEILFENCDTKNKVDAGKLISEYSGALGMIKGQYLDLACKEINKDKYYEIIDNKTSKLILAPILTASILSNKSYYDDLYVFGKNLGELFQIKDDILDVEGTFEIIGKTPNKDINEDKLSAVKVFGLEKSKEIMFNHFTSCKNALSNIPNNKFLLQLTDFIYNRKK